MQSFRTYIFAAVFLAFGAVSQADDLPDGFPSDITFAEYMQVFGVSEVRGDYSVSLRAPGKSVGDIVSFFKGTLGSSGWKLEGESVSAKDAILPFSKDGRRVGVSVTDFILDGSGQLDRSTKGITVQVSAAPDKLDASSLTLSNSAED